MRTISLKLPDGLRLAGRDVPAADGTQVPLYLFRLPDGSDMDMVVVPAGVASTEDKVHTSSCEQWLICQDGVTVYRITRFFGRSNGRASTTIFRIAP